MGSMLQSQCKCGFESDELTVGGGMMFIEEECDIPYYCDKCEIVKTINIFKKLNDSFELKLNNPIELKSRKDLKCKKCRRKVQYYGEIGENNLEFQEEYIFDWMINDEKRYFLQNKPYYCPKCKKENLQFHSVGNWD